MTFAEAALGAQAHRPTGSGASVEVRIPPGVETGGRLRLPGQGAPAPARAATPGDLYLEIDGPAPIRTCGAQRHPTSSSTCR